METIFFSCDEPLRYESGESGILIAQTTADYVLDAHQKLDLISANLRVQGMNQTVRKILDTLSREPEMFVFKADPLKLSIDAAFYDPLKRELICSLDSKKGHGFVNGGGRIRAFCAATEQSVDLSKIPVFLQIAYGLKTEKQVDVCVASNTSTKVDSASILNKQGVFEPIKERWGDKLPYCVYFQGQHAEQLGKAHSDSPSASVALLTKLMLAVSSTYDYDAGKHPTLVVRGGSISSNGIARANIDHRLHLLGDLYDIWFYCMKEMKAYIDRNGWVRKNNGLPHFPSVLRGNITSTHFMHTPLKWNGDFPSSLPLPVVAACRVFLCENNWIVDRKWLMEEAVPTLWKQYKDTMVGNDKSTQKISVNVYLSENRVWSSLVSKAQTLLLNYNKSRGNVA